MENDECFRVKAADGSSIFADLEYDEEIFEGEGDPQFDVYRHMQVAVERKWDQFQPKTNVHWLAFLAGWLGRNLKNESKTKSKLTRLAKALSKHTTARDVEQHLDFALPESLTKKK